MLRGILVISLKLFTNALEDVFKILQQSGLGINVNIEYFTYLHFAGDIVIIAESLQYLQKILSSFNAASRRGHVSKPKRRLDM